MLESLDEVINKKSKITVNDYQAQSDYTTIRYPIDPTTIV